MDEYDEYEHSKQSTKRYKKARTVLQKTFGHQSFRPDQYKIINHIVNCKDVLGIMPTGRGKSLLYHFIPVITDEVCIVISPLIALMDDQKMILDNLGISCCCYNSSLTLKEKRDMEHGLQTGIYKVLYITPESLVNNYDMVRRIYETAGVCVIAIDEAHCLSSFGFDFRPAYRMVCGIRDVMPNVPVLAVTATATQQVADDIKQVMKMTGALTVVASFDRPNITLNVKMYTHDTMDDIIRMIRDIVSGSVIIYCVTIKDTEMIAEYLQEKKIECFAYHAKLTKDIREKVQDGFMNNTVRCISATIAFGMGINKDNVRLVVNYGCPQNIESYYQEIGRAGRDGKESSSVLYYKQKDFMIQQRFINNIADTEYKTVRSKMLDQMSKYVSASTCRRQIILNYFNQDVKINNCGNCDNCLVVEKKIDTKDEMVFYQLIHTVDEIKNNQNHGFGISTMVLILKGSAGKKIKSWMKNLQHYGKMKSQSAQYISSIFHKIISLGYLENCDIGSCIYVIQITKQGIAFLQKYELMIKNKMKENDFDAIECFL